MSKKGYIILGVVVFLVVFLLGLGFEALKRGGFKKGDSLSWFLEEHKRKVFEEEEKKIKELWNEAITKIKPLKEDLAKHEEKLLVELAKDKPEEKNIKDLTSEISKLNKEIADEKINLLKKAKEKGIKLSKELILKLWRSDWTKDMFGFTGKQKDMLIIEPLDGELCPWCPRFRTPQLKLRVLTPKQATPPKQQAPSVKVKPIQPPIYQPIPIPPPVLKPPTGGR